MARQTLQQQRAAYAWAAVRRAQRQLARPNDFRSLAKGAPALVTTQGLMAALAFYASRNGSAPAQLLGELIRGWLDERFAAPQAAARPEPASHVQWMERLLHAPSALHLQATDEVLDLLQWLYRFAAAVADEP